MPLAFMRPQGPMHTRCACGLYMPVQSVFPPQYIVIVGCGLHRTLQVCQIACLCTGWCRRMVPVTSTGVVRGKGVAGMQGHSPQARPLHALLRSVLAEGGCCALHSCQSAGCFSSRGHLQRAALLLTALAVRGTTALCVLPWASTQFPTTVVCMVPCAMQRPHTLLHVFGWGTSRNGNHTYEW